MKAYYVCIVQYNSVTPRLPSINAEHRDFPTVSSTGKGFKRLHIVHC